MSDLMLDVINHLSSVGIIEGDGVDSFRDFTPEEPSHIIVINEYAGSPPSLQESAVHRSFQILVRDKSAKVAKAKCSEIFNELNPLNRLKILNNGRWCQLYPRQTPFKMKVDDSGRVSYGFNIGITSNRD